MLKIPRKYIIVKIGISLNSFTSQICPELIKLFIKVIIVIVKLISGYIYSLKNVWAIFLITIIVVLSVVNGHHLNKEKVFNF